MLTKDILHAFHIPQELLDSLRPVEKEAEIDDDILQQQEVTVQALKQLQLQEERLANEQKDEIDGTSQFTCHTCDQVFVERTDQRLHFNSDWHRYNIKRKLVLDAKPVSLSEFESLLEDLTESLSGSEEEEENEEEEVKDSISALVNKQQEEEESSSIESTPFVLPVMKKYSALVWYRTDLYPNIHYGIYRPVLGNHTLSEIQQSEWKDRKRTWTLIMLGGGHFAGAVFDVSSSNNQNTDQMKLIAHKTFHRYTTRRKQGGAQSANDNAKGKAKSAGAQIRRYNEQLLQQEVRDILLLWKQHITASEHVFIHAPSNNKKILFNYDGAVLTQDRVDNIPFATRRPTLNELRRVFKELVTVKSIHMDEDMIEEHRLKWIAKDEKHKKSLQNSTLKKKKETTDTKKKEYPDLDKFIQLIKQNKTSVAISFMEKHPFLPYADALPDELNEDLRHYPTLLHIAASQGNAEVVSELLRKYEANPTVVSEVGKTAYEVSKDKETRNAFRRCMHDMPTQWAWLEEGRVPSPLTKEQEEAYLKKERKRKAREEEEKRRLEEERRREENERERIAEEKNWEKMNADRSRRHLLPIAKALGGRTNPQSFVNMTPEARMRLEREKRARAAEERMKK